MATAQPGATPGHYVLIKPNPCGWDAPLPTAKEYARHYVPAACHRHVVNEAVFAGHKPEWVDGFEVGTKTYFNSVHRPDGGAIWSARHGLTATQYQEAFDTFVPAGFRATLVESYLQEGKVRYAVIFVKDGAPKPVAYHGYTQAQHQAMANNLVYDGFRPVNVSVVSVGGNRSYTALFEKIDVGSFQLTSTIPQADYQKWVDDNIEAGRRLVYVNGYAHAGSMWFAAIATSAASPNYQAVHGLTSAQYQQAWAQYAGSMPTRVVTGYAAGNQALFAAIWRK